MPTTINGTYWTVRELAETLNVDAGLIMRSFPKGYDMPRIGNIWLIPDDIAQEIIAARKAEGDMVPFYYTQQITGLSNRILRQLARDGFPHTTTRIGVPTFKREHVEILAEVAKRLRERLGLLNAVRDGDLIYREAMQALADKGMANA